MIAWDWRVRLLEADLEVNNIIERGLVPGHEAFERLGWHDDGCDVTVEGQLCEAVRKNE